MKSLTHHRSSSLQVLDGFPESGETGAGSLNVMLLKLLRMAECGRHPTTLHSVLNILTDGFIEQLALDARLG
jgi:hypothetical protein